MDLMERMENTQKTVACIRRCHLSLVSSEIGFSKAWPREFLLGGSGWVKIFWVLELNWTWLGGLALN